MDAIRSFNSPEMCISPESVKNYTKSWLGVILVEDRTPFHSSRSPIEACESQYR